MANLTAGELVRVARMAGEGHKLTGDRMVDDATLDLIAGDVALLKDADGLAPPEVGYVITVDLYRTAAEAWRTKAGMVADGYDFKAEGASFTRSQMYDHYMQQAGRYANMASSLTAQVSRPVTDDGPLSAYEEWLDGGGG